MRFSSLSKVEKLCIIGMGVLFLVIVLCVILLFQKSQLKQDNGLELEHRIEEDNNTLADELDLYPDKMKLDEPIPELLIYDEAGNALSLSQWEGKNILILFWTSWCKYCNQEMDNIQEYAELLKDYQDVELILLNKLDGEKETQEQALAYLKEKNISFTTYFDKDMSVYKEFGIKIVPTLLGINEDGVLKLSKPGLIGGSQKLAGIIDYVKYGGSYQTEEFIREHLTSKEGGVHVNYFASNEEAPSGYDVLSESQGIMMEYAVIKKDQVLFDRYYKYVKSQMLLSDSLAGWMVADKGPSSVNALLDDLRIYRSLYDADLLWGGYGEEISRWERGIEKYNLSKNHYVDFYDFNTKKKANRFTLCYADFEALRTLAEKNSKYKTAYDNAYQLVFDGYIDDDFPFYYSWYDYRKEGYVLDDLNMAEAMYTLLNLARIGELKSETKAWLEQALDTNGIKARYTVHGKEVEGYQYESTAIYGIVAMIGEETGNQRLKTQALLRMETMRVNDKRVEWNGAFSDQLGLDIFSFDQCIPLLAYATIETQ